MKKTFFIILLAFLLTACQTKNQQAQEDRFDNNPNIRDDIEMYNDQKELPNCFDLCHSKIQEICVDDIVDLESNNTWYGDSILDTDFCDKACNSWSDDVLECMGKATKCDSVSTNEPYCREEEDNSAVEYIDDREINYDCSSACYKYKVCAMMADDATTEDGNEAYNTCFEECQNWSEKTLTCMKNTDTGTSMGCAFLSQCGLAEYGNILK